MSSYWKRIRAANQDIDVLVDRHTVIPGRRLFPSVGEYPVYDDFLYFVMLQDEARNVLFEQAIKSVAHGRVVLELGTGPDLLWAGLAAELGAARVMAVEQMPTSAQAAAAKAATLYGRQVEVFSGSANDVSLPQRAEVLIVELVGAIGGSEGIAEVVRDARRRHLTADAHIIPSWVATRVAGIGLRSFLGGPPRIHENILPYVATVWNATNTVFDLRLCVTGLAPADLLSTNAALEDLDLQGDKYQFAEELTLEVHTPGELDSLVMWLQMACGSDQVLDSLETTTNWMPTLVPFDLEEPLVVRPGDTIAVRCQRRLADAVHPEWEFEGEVRRQDYATVAFRSVLPYAQGPLRHTWLHRALLRTRT